MKTRNLFFLFVLLITSLLQSCSEDEGGSTTNAIKIDGNPFKAIAPSIVGVSLDGEGHAAISFTNGGASSMKTLTIDFEYSPDESLSGTYSYPVQGTDRLIDEWLTNYTSYDGETIYDTQLQEGTITIKHNGSDNYTVSMDLTMEDGTVFTGTYSGKFTTQFQNG